MTPLNRKIARMRRRKRCWSCRYFGPMTGTVGTCDYLLETGHPRSRICPVGDACTVYEPRAPEAKPRRLLQNIPERDEEPYVPDLEIPDDSY